MATLRLLTCAVGAFCCLLFPCWSLAAPAAPTAKDLLHNALLQMGGEDQIRAVRTVRFTAMGHRNMLEQSERPEGPYIVEYDEISQSRDLEHGRWKQVTTMRVAVQPPFKQTAVVSDGAASLAFDNQTRPGSNAEMQDAEEDLDLGPEHVLLTALNATDLRREADTVLQSVPNQVVAFTWEGSPVRIFLNAYTSLPTAVEWKRANPYQMFWSTWGDVTTRIYYSLWWLCPHGIHYPLQWDVFRNGLPDRVLTITEVVLNPQFPADEFSISNDIRAAFAKQATRTVDDRKLDVSKAQEPAKDVVFISGAWNTTLVRQDDGIVVIEAPISSGYSAQVIAEAGRRWPGVPIKAAISTSDSWPHIAGVREYVARGIPVYAPDLNIPILLRLVNAPRSSFPDLLARSPRQPDFRAVSEKTVIGSGVNRMEIYLIRGETSERQMMVYFPQHKLLYGSDPFQKLDPITYFYPQTVWELRHAVEREMIKVRTFFMMHVNPTPWSDLDQALGQAEQAPAK